MASVFGRTDVPPGKVGESWELSAVEGNASVVSNGFLAGNSLDELVEIYMGELVGEKIYQRFGIEFPLLIKFIDAQDDLSIQVHPDDVLAAERHNAYGKTEMWYVLQAEAGAQLVSGFNQPMDAESYSKHLQNNTLERVLNTESVATGDIFFIPPGRVHAIGRGILLAEIQQTSDVTYRIWDYNRPDDTGQLRELHTDWALDAIDFGQPDSYRTQYQRQRNKTVPTVHCSYFTTNLIDFDQAVEKDYSRVDSFVVYICVAGQLSIEYGIDQFEHLTAGQTLLLPAELNNLVLTPTPQATILEVYIA